MRVLIGRPELRPYFAFAALSGATMVFLAAATMQRAILPSAMLVMLVGFVVFVMKPLLRWHNLLAVLVLMMLFVPVKRYHLPAALPFELDPYRIFVMLLAAGWIISLFIDLRVRLRSSPLQGPMLLWIGATFASIATNKDRIEELHVETLVIKQLSIFLSFMIVYFLFVSLVHTREHIDFIVRLLTISGTIVALSGLVEYRTHYNFFNHLSQFFPVLRYDDPALVAGLDARYLYRAGEQRIYASAAHPIELSATLMLLMPLAIYLFMSTGKRRWLACAGLLTMGALATVSRTGIIMLLVIAVVYYRLRPVHVKRLLPLLLPAMLVVYFALPNTIGSFYAAFFPKQGLVAEQSEKVHGNSYGGDGRLADIGPSMTELAEHPVFGQGYGTRVSSRASETKGIKRNARILDNQWLYSLLETGIIGIFAIVVVFRRAARRLAREARDDPGPDGWLAAGMSAAIYAYAIAMLTFDAFGFLQVTFIALVILALASSFFNLRAEAAEPEAR